MENSEPGFAYLYIIVVVCMYVYLYILLLVQRPEEGEVFSVTLSYSLETGSLPKLRARLVASTSRECHVSATQSTEITDNKTDSLSSFCWVLRI